MARKESLSLNADGRIIRYGQALGEMLGYTSEEVCGKDLSFLSPRGMEPIFSGLLDAARKAAVADRKIIIKHKEGFPVDMYVSAYPMKDQSGKLYSMMLDLSTDESAAPPAILSEEFQRIFRFSNDAVAVTDKDGSIIDVNQAFLDTYGYEMEEVLGKNPRILKSTHSTPEMYEKMWKDILDPAKGYWRGEIINVTKDRREVPVLLSINAIKDSSGEVRNFLGIAFNMTRHKELDRMNKMYVDYIVHDIKNPLTSIMVNSEMLLAQVDTGDFSNLTAKIEKIILGAQKLNYMATDILNYSRAQNGDLPLKKDRVSFADILRQAVQPFENSGKNLFVNGFSYRGSLADDFEVAADGEKLQRIIYNLLSNAFKYASNEVRVQARFGEEGFLFSVTNDGKRFARSEFEKIFDPFYQTEDGIKTGGAGLGLSIVKSFVEAHGGKVWTEAPEGGGVTFGFSLPA